MEIWKDIEGYEGLYKISTYGKVKSLGKGKSFYKNLSSERLISLRLKKNGYLQVKLHKNGGRKHFLLHRLVALHFIMNYDNKPEVNHKDGDKCNNNIFNLEWVTPSENQKHAFLIGKQKPIKGAKNKQSKKVMQLSKNGEVIKEWDSIGDIKRELNFNSFGIIKCCKKEKKYKTAYGYKWEYV